MHLEVTLHKPWGRCLCVLCSPELSLNPSHVQWRFDMSFIFPFRIINASNAALASDDVIAQSVITLLLCWLLSQKFPEEMRSGTRLRAADIMVFGRRPAIVCNCPVGLTCKTCPEDTVLEMVGVSDGLYFSQYSAGEVGEVFFKWFSSETFTSFSHHISTGAVLFLFLQFHSRLMLWLSNTVLTHGAFQQLGHVPVLLLRTYSSHPHPKWLKYFSIHSVGRKYDHTLWSRLSVIWTLRRVHHKTLKVYGYG